MKILIAGGAGYVGNVLIPKLLDRGYKVDVVDLFWFGNNLPRQVGILHKDIFQLSVEDLEPYDQVIFLAGLSNDPMAEFSPSKNFIFNAAAPAYLAYTAKKAKVKRYIYASSCSVYGYTENELYDETRPVIRQLPVRYFQAARRAGGHAVGGREFSVISLRKGTISGYSPRMRFDLIINTMFKSALREHTITINNPSIWRPILSIEDAATAYTRAIEANTDSPGFSTSLPATTPWAKWATWYGAPSRNGWGSGSIYTSSTFRISATTRSASKRQERASFHAAGDVKSIVGPSDRQHGKVQGLGQSACTPISQSFKQLENGIEVHSMAGADPMKVAVIGGNGQLGTRRRRGVCGPLATKIIALTHADIELADIDSVARV